VLIAAGDRLHEPFSPEAVRASGELLVYRFGAGLFFGNADVFGDDMRTIARVADGARTGGAP
jgi:hypothetical protein